MRPSSAFTLTNVKAIRDNNMIRNLHMNSSGTLGIVNQVVPDEISGIFTVGKDRSSSPNQKPILSNNESIFNKITP